MSFFDLTKDAEGDIDDIWSYVGLDDPQAADRLIDALYTRFEMLSAYPQAGRRIRVAKSDVRMLGLGRYEIVYQTVAEGVIILRVFHGARDLDKLLGD